MQTTGKDKDAKHTPTPWLNFDEVIRGPGDIGALAECYDDSFPVAYDGDPMNCNITWERAKENAAFIVRAVNAYDKNQETIKELSKLLTRAAAEIGHNPEHNCWSLCDDIRRAEEGLK